MITVLTHSGVFHADDVLSVALIARYSPYSREICMDYDHGYIKDRETNERLMGIVRSRHQSDIEQADIVLDVGDRYDPERGRFDHHQNPHGEEATCLLVFKHLVAKGLMNPQAAEFIKPFIQSVSNLDLFTSPARAFRRMNKDLFDNGLQSYSSLIGGMNPLGLEDKEVSDSAFYKAVVFSWQILRNLEARSLGKAYCLKEAQRGRECLAGDLIELKAYNSQWRYHLDYKYISFISFKDKSKLIRVVQSKDGGLYPLPNTPWVVHLNNSLDSAVIPRDKYSEYLRLLDAPNTSVAKEKLTLVQEWQKDSTYSAIPEKTLITFKNYIDEGIQPGSFIQSLLANDLAGAVGRADSENKILLGRLVTFVNCQVPHPAKGSWEKVQKWEGTKNINNK